MLICVFREYPLLAVYRYNVGMWSLHILAAPFAPNNKLCNLRKSEMNRNKFDNKMNRNELLYNSFMYYIES